LTKKLSIATVVSSDDYQYFLPLFTYCAHKAYPEAGIMTFVCGKLDPESRPYIHGEVYENMFSDYKIGVSTYNALRQLIPSHYFEGYDYLYPTDADFLIFRQKIPHVDYYAEVMKNLDTPIACARGPTKGLRSTRLPGGWVENRTRMAAGCLMLKIPEWFEKTRVARNYYREIVKNQERDRFDKVEACTYREFDEVMIYRICLLSAIRTPTMKDHFATGEKMDAIYRDIHLGDFKFKSRYEDMNKMRRILRKRNALNYLELKTDDKWNKIVDYVSGKSHNISRMIRKLDHHVNERK